MLDDTRQESYTPPQLVMALFGLMLVPRNHIQVAADLALGVTPGVAIMGDIGFQCVGRNDLAINAGQTLSDLSQVVSTTVFYWNPATDGVHLIVVDGAEALTATGAVAPTEAEIVAAIPPGSVYTLGNTCRFSRSGSAITLDWIKTADVRSYGVATATKVGGTVRQGMQEIDVIGANLTNGDGYYEPGPTIRITRAAAAIADGDLLTDFPLHFHGRVHRAYVICEVPITTAAKTTTLAVELGTTPIPGLSLVYAGAKALGAVEELAGPTTQVVFHPGDSLTITAAATTAFIEGSVSIVIETETLVTH